MIQKVKKKKLRLQIITYQGYGAELAAHLATNLQKLLSLMEPGGNISGLLG